ncbi:hypothetical protein LP420_36905 [Massilia sp. B-10]|nr:hypothetical protein LP420_36905 [Massilia sp. B-10]
MTGLGHLATAASQASALRSRMALPVVILTIALFVAPIPQLFLGLLTPSRVSMESRVAAARDRGTGRGGRALERLVRLRRPAPGPRAARNALLAVPVFGALHLRLQCARLCREPGPAVQ